MAFFQCRRTLIVSMFLLVLTGIIVISVLLTLSGSVNDSALGPSATSSSASPTEIVFPVVGSVAVRGDLSQAIEANGVIRGERDVDLVARLAGTVDSLGVTNGSLVRKGALLVQLDQREYRISIEKARTSLLSAQIEYRSLSKTPFLGVIDSLRIRRELEQIRDKQNELGILHSLGEMPGEEYSSRKRDLATDEAFYSLRRGDVISSRSGLSQAMEEYERALLNLERTEIRAPFDGAVANCLLVPHMTLAVGSTVCRLVDVCRLLVDVQVLESDIGRIHLGSKTEIRVTTYPDVVFHGVISALNPCVDAKSRTLLATVKVLPDNSSALLPLRSGMFARVRLESQVLRNRVLVPVTAVLVRDQRSLVFIARGGLAKWQYVTTGQRNETVVEILSGVTGGDTVLADGHYTLAHDASIVVHMHE